MNLNTTTTSFAQALGLTIPKDGHSFSRREVAALLRRPLARWGLAPKRALIRYAREQLDVLGIIEPSSDKIGKLLDQLVLLGECDEVLLSGQRYIALGTPRWIPTGNETGVVLSASTVPQGIKMLESVSPDDILRRVCIAADDDFGTLSAAGIQRHEFDEWLGPLGYLKHASRREGRLVRDDTLTLEGFWELLIRALTVEGHPLSIDAEVRILSGAPGGYFGDVKSPNCEGRWTSDATDGIWCAFRRGYGDQHWHPTLLSIRGENRRSLDLYDHDEWQWALLARSLAVGPRERITVDGTTWRLTCPIPLQLRAAMDLLGSRYAPWAWVVPEGAREFWSSFLTS